MPEFIRPKRAIIEPDDGRELLTLAVLVAVGLAVAAAVVSFVVAHAVLLCCCLMVFCVVLGGFAGWSRWATSPNRRAALQQAGQRRQLLETLPPAREIPAEYLPPPKRATWPQRESGYAEVARRSSNGKV